jgi:hypothetical protein
MSLSLLKKNSIYNEYISNDDKLKLFFNYKIDNFYNKKLRLVQKYDNYLIELNNSLTECKNFVNKLNIYLIKSELANDNILHLKNIEVNTCIMKLEETINLLNIKKNNVNKIIQRPKQQVQSIINNTINDFNKKNQNESLKLLNNNKLLQDFLDESYKKKYNLISQLNIF